jgi:hypothetical protein
MVFVEIMMLAFLDDQTQQLCFALFQSVARHRAGHNLVERKMSNMTLMYLPLMASICEQRIFAAFFSGIDMISGSICKSGTSRIGNPADC